MKAELIAEEVFTVQVGKYKTERMRVASRWNGLMELRTEKGQVLIVTEPGHSYGFDALFNNIFRTAEESKVVGTEIVMGSPDLTARLREAAAPANQPAPPEAPPTRYGP